MESRKYLDILEQYLHMDKKAPMSEAFIESMEEALAYAIDCAYIVADHMEEFNEMFEDEAL